MLDEESCGHQIISEACMLMGRGMLLDGVSSMQKREDIVLVEKPKGKKPCGRLRCRW
jgi:hypothetical protein